MELFTFEFKSSEGSVPPKPIIMTNKEFEILAENDYLMTQELLDKLQSEE